MAKGNLVYRFEVQDKAGNKKFVQERGFDEANARKQYRSRQWSFTNTPAQLLGQRVETKTYKNGSRHYSYDIVPIEESSDRRVVDLRTDEGRQLEASGAYKARLNDPPESSNSPNKSSNKSSGGSAYEAAFPEEDGQNTLPYEEAEQNLINGGLTGNALEMAKASLRSSYGNNTQPQQARSTNQPVQQMQAQAPQQSGYVGPSVVDYLKSVGQSSDFTTRTNLANQYGIQNYTGTAAQNTALLNMLRSAPTPQMQAQQAPAPQAQGRPDEALSGYGYELSPAAAESFRIAPAKSFKEVYDGVIDSLGLDSVKRNIDKVMKDINKLDQELADKVSDVNENPWLTEGVRRNQIQKLQERYDLKRAPYAANLTTMNDLYNNGRSEARYVAENTLRQYNQERQFMQEEINAWMEEQEEARKAMQSQSSDFKEVQGGLYNIKTGMWVVPPAPKTATSTGSTSNKPTQTDRNIDYYSRAGEELQSESGPDGYTKPEVYARLRQASPSATEFDKRFNYLVNPLSREKLGLPKKRGV